MPRPEARVIYAADGARTQRVRGVFQCSSVPRRIVKFIADAVPLSVGKCEFIVKKPGRAPGTLEHPARIAGTRRVKALQRPTGYSGIGRACRIPPRHCAPPGAAFVPLLDTAYASEGVAGTCGSRFPTTPGQMPANMAISTRVALCGERNFMQYFDVLVPLGHKMQIMSRFLGRHSPAGKARVGSIDGMRTLGRSHGRPLRCTA
jgi:hypothetical protein